MKKIVVIITFLIVGSFLLTSCGCRNEMTSHFAKRKYLKRGKKSKEKKFDKESTIEYANNTIENDVLLASEGIQEIIIEESVDETPFKKENNYEFNKSTSYEKPIEKVYDNCIKRFESVKLEKKREIVVDQIPERNYHKLAIMSFVGSLMPVFFGGFIFALVTGIKAAIEIEKNPEKYRGRGFAIAGLILGSIGLVLAIILVLMLMYPI